ncbi:unnamed protein product [Sphagnum balticum]
MEMAHTPSIRLHSDIVSVYDSVRTERDYRLFDTSYSVQYHAQPNGAGVMPVGGGSWIDGVLRVFHTTARSCKIRHTALP